MDSKQLTRLKSLLKELFQLDQPELDFGLYKIMHAKSKQVSEFLENDLLKEVEAAFGERDGANAVQLLAQAKSNLLATLGETALDSNGQLNTAFNELPAGKKYLEEVAAAEKAKEALNADAEIFDHLYRFFERYYDNGDFLSRRYYARESENRAAPYSVPYDGREVYLHWANKDQYYIKSSENFSNYSFDLKEAISKQSAEQGSAALDLALPNELKKFTVKLHIVDAEEGVHANIKASADQKREFIPYLDLPVELVINEDQTAELRLNFEYKVLPDGLSIDEETETRLKSTYGFSNKGETPPHWMADVFLSALNALPSEHPESASVVQAYALGLSTLAPTEKQTKRPLLAKYISKYIASNTMDYFIHKDLGGFLRRELDFYIKNEVIRLDDIVKADVAKAKRTLEKIDCFRRIAQFLITFLAQLEDFQKKLWLKKKFVTETNYCITLDRVPEALYPAIAANDAQRIEWVELYSINEIQSNTATVGYSVPLTVEFLKENPFLLIDTALFDSSFREYLLSSIECIDNRIDGILVHSENFQALNLMRRKYEKSVNCIFIDPPYNTGGDGFLYKDGYQQSSWLSLMSDRLITSKKLLRDDGVNFTCIGDDEEGNLRVLLDDVFCLPSIPYNWKSRAKPTNAGEAKLRPQIVSEFVYQNNLKKSISYFPLSSGVIRKYPNKDDFGSFRTTSILTSNLGRYKRETMRFEIGGYKPPEDKRWKAGEAEILALYNNNRIDFNDEGEPFRKHYEGEEEEQHIPLWTFMPEEITGTAESGKSDLSEIIGNNHGFDSVKPKELITVFLNAIVKKDGLVFDYFGGTGTTAHAVMSINKEDGGSRKYVLVEVGEHFDAVLKARIKKLAYSESWKNGKSISNQSGISHCFKYIRLESYDDTLNNLVLREDSIRNIALANNAEIRKDYMLKYWLDVETTGSPSLLNVDSFTDPENYVMHIKKPGSESQVPTKIDLVETFNWLIGLWVEHMAKPETFEGAFEREIDPDLPADQNTRLVCKRLRKDVAGSYWFRLIEGYTLKVPGDDTSRQKTLIVWRKLTDDPEKDNAALQYFLMDKLQISPREKTYDVIYVNGSHTLPNPVIEGERTKVRLIEEAFHNAMWSEEVR